MTQNVNLSPTQWQADYDKYLAAQNVDKTRAGEARGSSGAVTVAYNGLAARAGLEALKQGGSAVDAALTAAMAQVVLTAGAPISFFGILSMVYFEAATGKVHSMNAEWATVKGETDPTSIPGGLGFGSPELLRGTGAPSGRTALVGGFMKGVGEAHQRFGKLPFAQLFAPSIHIAEKGMPVTDMVAEHIEFRAQDLARLPETRGVFTKSDGSFYKSGDLFCQPALGKTLRRIAEEGADYMYRGEWAKKLVAAVQADGGHMTLEDLSSYEVQWSEAITAELADGYSLRMGGMPNMGSANLIEALHLAEISKLTDDGPWWESGKALKKAVDICSQVFAMLLPEAQIRQIYPGMDFSFDTRLTRAHAETLWARMEAGAKLGQYKPRGINHSDDVVVIDKDGNMAAITHSINTILWGKTAIFVDGVSISDAASYQQAQIAALKPGERLPSPTEQGILCKDGVPVLAFASMGAGLHHRSFQGLLNVMKRGMTVPEAINAPDFYFSKLDMKDMKSSIAVPEGRFSKKVLQDTGVDCVEVPLSEARLGGEGKWVAISRDPATGALEAGSHNRNNSDAVAY